MAPSISLKLNQRLSPTRKRFSCLLYEYFRFQQKMDNLKKNFPPAAS
jgi:hypothetical protein